MRPVTLHKEGKKAVTGHYKVPPQGQSLDYDTDLVKQKFTKPTEKSSKAGCFQEATYSTPSDPPISHKLIELH